MFYSQDILQKRGGRFGVVWLAALRFSQLSRRDLCSINVRKTCDEIIDYILLRMPPLRAGGGRPRFSLYLSSQLMYGVVRVFSKQQEFLLGDASAFFTRIKVSASTVDIDLKTSSRSDLVTNADLVSQAGYLQPGFDPTFGCFTSHQEFLQTMGITEMEILLSPGLSPRRPISLSPPPAKRFRAELGSPHTVSSSDDISLKEFDRKLSKDIQVPGEKELPHFDGTELEMILEEPEIGLKMDDMISLSKPPASTPLPSASVSLSAMDKDRLPPQEETPVTKPVDEEPPTKRPRRQTPGVTPIEPVPSVRETGLQPSLSMVLSPVTPSPVRRRRKRQLMFADREIQLSKETVRLQLTKGKDLCEKFVLPCTKISSATDLLSQPGRQELRDGPLRHLWQRNTKFGISETDSDRELPFWTLPHFQSVKENLSEQRVSEWLLDESEMEKQRAEQHVSVTEREAGDLQEEPSMELLRDVSMATDRSRQMEELSISLERSRGTELEVSHEVGEDLSIRRPRSRSQGGTSSEDEPDRLLEPQQVEEQRAVTELSALYVVPEEQEISLGPIPEPTLEPSPKMVSKSRERAQTNLLRFITRNTAEREWTTFRDVCPAGKTTKVQAARMFSVLLDLCAGQTLHVTQEMEYGDIFISQRGL